MVAEPRHCWILILFGCLLVFLCWSCEEQDLVIQWLEGICSQDNCSMAAEESGIGTHGTQLESRSSTVLTQTGRVWRVKFEAYADLAKMGAHLDVAAEQLSFITHDGLDTNSVTISKTVHTLLITKCQGKALSLVSLVPRRFGLEARRVLKVEYEGKKWHSHSSARERYSQPTCHMAKDVQRGTR